MKKPLTLGDSGSIQSGDKETVPKRSWRKGDGGFNETFDFEGATIYIAFPADWDKIEAVQKKTQADVKRLSAVQKSYSDKTDDEIPEEEIEQIKTEAREATARGLDFNNKLICECVIGWKGLPFPFSVEERAALPVEVKAKWATRILEVSQISQAEAGFLAK